jgi:DNA-binding transcriptional LysR family regulator
MQQYNLPDIHAFIKVVESGSFTRAAQQLDTSTAAVSRRVSMLENALDVKLLNRTTRRLHLTDAGEQYFNDVQNILAALEEAEQKVQRGKQDIKGNLRIAAPLSFGIERIARVLPAFLKRYPQLNVHLQLEDKRTDLLAEGIDLSIRIGKLEDSSLIATKIGQMSLVYCASPEYLADHGTPGHPSELDKHKVLRYSLISAKDEWALNQQGGENIALQWQLSANNGEVLREAAIQGLGIVMLPTFIALDALRDGRLREVMGKYTQDSMSIYAVRPSRQFTPAKIHRLIGFLKQQSWDHSE